MQQGAKSVRWFEESKGTARHHKRVPLNGIESQGHEKAKTVGVTQKIQWDLLLQFSKFQAVFFDSKDSLLKEAYVKKRKKTSTAMCRCGLRLRQQDDALVPNNNTHTAVTKFFKRWKNFVPEDRVSVILKEDSIIRQMHILTRLEPSDSESKQHIAFLQNPERCTRSLNNLPKMQPLEATHQAPRLSHFKKESSFFVLFWKRRSSTLLACRSI